MTELINQLPTAWTALSDRFQLGPISELLKDAGTSSLGLRINFGHLADVELNKLGVFEGTAHERKKKSSDEQLLIGP